MNRILGAGGAAAARDRAGSRVVARVRDRAPQRAVARRVCGPDNRGSPRWGGSTAGHADYRMPVPGLYLCGSGAHPGGGVTGAPGHNAAREIVRDFRRRRVA